MSCGSVVKEHKTGVVRGEGCAKKLGVRKKKEEEEEVGRARGARIKIVPRR